MEEAILKAIEGGYLPMKANGKDWVVIKEIYLESIHSTPSVYVSVTLEPKFWQALGKSLGWLTMADYEKEMRIDPRTKPQWWFKWHKFIDHLAENKDPEIFFTELLAK